MKKWSLIIALLGIVNYGFSQNRNTEFPHNEVNYNIFNTIAVASAEVGYEYFFDFNQSVGAKILINDRPSYRSENNGDEFHTNSFRLNYTYYFGKENPGSEFYVQPFMKYRFGNFEETLSNGMVQKTNMDMFMIGFGVGYVWNFSNSFVVGPFANIARGFSDAVKDRFSAIDFNAGINLGYRF